MNVSHYGVKNMEKYMMEFATESLPGIELDPARLNWMAGPLFPSFTGSVLLTLDGMLLGIELDSQALSPWDGVEKCRKWLLLPMYSNGPSQLVGIQWAFKWTWGTFIFELHWVSSAIQFVGCTCLRTQFTHLRTELMVEVAEGLYCTGKMLDPGN